MQLRKALGNVMREYVELFRHVQLRSDSKLETMKGCRTLSDAMRCRIALQNLSNPSPSVKPIPLLLVELIRYLTSYSPWRIYNLIRVFMRIGMKDTHSKF